MRHLFSRKDFEKSKPELSEYAPVGTAHCKGKCDREVIVTKNGPVVACKACKRIVIDNRDK